MTKYLIRRRNRWGRYVHLATWDFEPTDQQIESAFGPGEYTILMARESIVGLARVRDVSISWEIEYVGWIDGEPTIDYIRDNYGNGHYYTLRNCKVTPYQVFPTDQPHNLAWRHLQDGAPVMKSITVIFRVKLPWV